MSDSPDNKLTQRQTQTSTSATMELTTSSSASSSAKLPLDPNHFILDGYQHDQNTFTGRLKHQLTTTNPSLMFKSDDEIKSALKLLKDFKYNPESVLKRDGMTHQKLWNAQTIKRASTNADTLEIIPQPFRLCGFVTFNMPVLVGLVWPNPSKASILFWQWMNQSHNGAINYFNRNATNATDYKLLAASYTAACAGAMTVPFLFKNFVNSRAAWSEAKKLAMNRYAAFPAVCIANTINMYCMRSKELFDGIDVTDSQTGQVLGKSKKAANDAILETALSRAIITAGVLFVPPFLDNMVQPKIDQKFKGHARLPAIKTSALVVICAACFYAVLPVSVAAFTQYKQMDVKYLEEDLRKKAKGDYVIYNRGQ